MSEPRRTHFVITLIVMVLLVGVFGFLSKIGKYRVGADALAATKQLTTTTTKPKSRAVVTTTTTKPKVTTTTTATPKSSVSYNSKYDFNCDGNVDKLDPGVVDNFWFSKKKKDVATIIAEIKKCKNFGAYLNSTGVNNKPLTVDQAKAITTQIEKNFSSAKNTFASYNPKYDLNCNGKVDKFDSAFIDYLLNSTIDDGTITSQLCPNFASYLGTLPKGQKITLDLLLPMSREIQNNYSEATTPVSFVVKYDFNCDGRVDQKDTAIIDSLWNVTNRVNQTFNKNQYCKAFKTYLDGVLSASKLNQTTISNKDAAKIEAEIQKNFTK